MRGLLPIFRPVYRTRCADGIASEEDFASQRRRSRRVLRVAEAYADIFKQHGLTLATGVEGGFSYVQPDSWSVKLSLLALPEDYLSRLDAALSEYGGADKGVRPRKERLLKYAKDAREASTGGEAHKYVLLNEGPREWLGHAALMACLERHGALLVYPIVPEAPTT